MKTTPFLHHLFPTSLLLLLLLNFHPSNTLTLPISPTQPPTSAPSSTTSSTLDPKQLRALQSLNFPTTKDPCSNHNAGIKCDSSKPFRHLISLRLLNCSDDVSLSITALKSLSTLQDLQFIDCPVAPVTFPAELTSNLKTFTCINSLRKLSGVWLSRLQNVTDLTLINTPVKASGPVIILAHMKKLGSIILSQANLTGNLPGKKSLSENIATMDLSGNHLKGKIPNSLTELENLASLNLSSNQLSGELPATLGNLIELRNLSVSSNSLSGSIPESIVAIPSLVTLDLSSNQFNGTIPTFLGEMKSLKYLNLERNNFQGILPFNASFIKRLQVFRVGENANLCYNHTILSSKLKLGIAPCDKNGFPVSPPSKSSSDGGGDTADYSDDGSSSEDATSQTRGGHHGPNKVVLGVAIALSSIVFLIIFLILLSRRCA